MTASEVTSDQPAGRGPQRPNAGATPFRRPVARRHRRTTAFVLSGGGSLGAIQVGMLRALLEADIRPDLVVGTSVGALNAAFLVDHLDLDGIDAMERLWRSIHRRDVFRISPLHLVRGTMGSQNHLFSPLGLQSLVHQAGLGFSRLEDAPVPVHGVATDLFNGEAVVLSEGDVVEALQASAAIPGVFPPVRIGKRTLIDGGVVANLPVRQAFDLGATRVFVLPAISGQLAALPTSALDVMLHATAIAAAALARSDLEQVRQSTGVRVLPYPDGAVPSMFDFDETPSLIESAYNSSAAWLQDESRTDLRGLPNATEDPAQGQSPSGESRPRHRSTRGSRNGRSRPSQPVA